MENNENLKITDNIIFSIEKLFQINRKFLWDIGIEEGLSPIQIQFLDYINKMSEQNNTISNLSLEFELKKSTVSDSINNLIKKGFLEKIKDHNDKRISYLHLTKMSKDKLSIIQNRNKFIFDKINERSKEEKVLVLSFLMNLIKEYYENGLIQSVKMCLTCANFQKNRNLNSQKPHYCNFLNINLDNGDLHFNCNSHQIN